VSRGRLISEFPSDWREIVCRRAYDVSSTKAASIAARLKPSPGLASVKKWIPTSRAFDRGKDWLSNAERHESSRPFDVIVARKNPRDKGSVLVAGEFAKDQPPWKTNTQKEVPRTAESLLDCVRLLFQASNELMLVDQNFDAAEPRFRDPFAALVGARDGAKPWQRCELHVGHPLTKQGSLDKAVLGNRIHHMRYHLAALVPKGSTLRVCFWYRKSGGKKLHPRFILTEYGGVQVDYGLDEGDSGGDTTIVSLMDHDLWQVVRGDYGLGPGRAPAFETASDCICEIAGEG